MKPEGVIDYGQYGNRHWSEHPNVAEIETLRAEIAELRIYSVEGDKALAAAQQEIAELKAERQARELQLCGMYQPNSLAASQAREMRLREVLDAVGQFNMENKVSPQITFIIRDALSQPQDDTALREMLMRVAEKVYEMRHVITGGEELLSNVVSEVLK